jgi:Flp pilus assembly pilin Flp
MKPNSKKRTNQGQAMMEYIILVALLAVASIPVVTMLGDVFRDRATAAADKMVDRKAGYHEQGVEIVREKQDQVRKSMSDFYE